MEISNIYGQFCPVAMASEILCTRWTPLVLRELISGSTRFNDIRRGVPKMSPTLLSKRLKELEAAGVIEIRKLSDARPEYHLTEAGEELRPLIVGLGSWGHRWIESDLSLRNLDPSLLMWDIRRNFEPDPPPATRCTIQFLYPGLESRHQDWWLVVEPDDVDLCRLDPGFDVDIVISAELRALTAVWMGIARMADEIDAGRITIDGAPGLARQVLTWFKLSLFAEDPRRVS